MDTIIEVVLEKTNKNLEMLRKNIVDPHGEGTGFREIASESSSKRLGFRGSDRLGNGEALGRAFGTEYKCDLLSVSVYGVSVLYKMQEEEHTGMGRGSCKILLLAAYWMRVRT